MVRKPVDIVHVNVRIRESLRLQIEREAKKHQTSLNNEIRLRLEDSFEQADRRDREAITDDMKITWARFAERFLLLDLEENLAQALAQTKDPEVAKLATAWLEIRKVRLSNDGRAS